MQGVDETGYGQGRSRSAAEWRGSVALLPSVFSFDVAETRIGDAVSSFGALNRAELGERRSLSLVGGRHRRW
jgi:hypothetical protein